MVKETHQRLSARKHLPGQCFWEAVLTRIRAMALALVRGIRQPGTHYRLALLLALLLAVLLECALSTQAHDPTVLLLLSTCS